MVIHLCNSVLEVRNGFVNETFFFLIEVCNEMKLKGKGDQVTNTSDSLNLDMFPLQMLRRFSVGKQMN